MSQWLQWIILSSVTGSPIGSAIILIVFWYTVDRFTLGLMPDPVRWFMRRRREVKLQRMLLANKHDRQAARELAELSVMRGNHAKALTLLKANLEAGDDDSATVFTMGVACLGAGHSEQGEKLLAHLQETHPEFRVGEIDFALGRARLARGDFKGARAALEAGIKVRRGTIEGRYLLSKALRGLGDDPGAALMRDETWNEYVSAPGFQRRKERLWAWRARPSRPATYAVLVLMVLVLFGRFAAPALSGYAGRMNDPYNGYGYRPAPQPQTPEPVDE
jgi:hypothetical protein